jgi:predicted transport protein
MRDALERTSEGSKAIVEGLEGRLRGLGARRGDRITVRVGSHWVAWRSERSGRVFAELRPLRERVEVFILPRPRDLRDPRGLARGAPRTQGWGWFRTRFEIRSRDSLEGAYRLIRQSYEYGRKMGNSRRPRALPR